MKLHSTISDTKHEVEFTQADGTIHAVVDGRKYTLDVSQPEPGLYVLRDGASKTLAFVSNTDDGNSLVSIDGRTIDVTLIDPRGLRGSSVNAESADGAAEIKTAMPGKVVRLLLAQGAEVAKGDGVMVIEAMKMQNEIKAPKDGILKDIRVAEGDTVNAGQILAVIE